MKGADILKWASPNGHFVRQVSQFRNKITKDGPFTPEPSKYQLYVSEACPWAHRTLLYLKLKGLEDVIGVTVVHYLMGEKGWRFSKPEEDPECQPDPEGNEYLRDLYLKVNPEYTGRFTVPMLYDKKLKTIVNNESSEIIRMLNSEFNEFAKNKHLDLYPESLREEIDSINEWVYTQLNNGVYKAGFATSQEAYNENAVAVFDALDRVEDLLSKRPWLAGDVLTEADVRLFTTIYRFDPVYHGHFKCNLKSIKEYPNIMRWLRTFYQLKGVKETCNMDHIKRHYYMSHTQINPTRVVPLNNGPDLDSPKETPVGVPDELRLKKD